MITPEILDKIELLISSQKAALYKKRNQESWFYAYKDELMQAKEIFIYLHFLEIFLRNKIANEFSFDFGNWFFDQETEFKLDLREKEKVDQVLISLNKSNKISSSDNIISNLSLGFWTNLFHKSYSKVWQQNKMIERVFPFLKSHQRNIKQIQKELEIIRKFRNRIFHFESLQSFNIEEMERLIFKFIYGISGVKIWEILK